MKTTTSKDPTENKSHHTNSDILHWRILTRKSIGIECDNVTMSDVGLKCGEGPETE